MGFYDEMQAVATELLGEFKQGIVKLRRYTPGTPNPATPWVPAAPTKVDTDLSAVVKRLHQRYENGALVVETGDMVTFSVPAVAPLITDKIVLSGVERSITNLTPIPPSGTVVAYKAWCAL